MVPLFPNETAALETIRAFIAKHSYAPTIRELGKLLNMTPVSAHNLIHRLADKKYLKRTPWKRRAIELIPQGAVVVLNPEIDRLVSAYAKEHGIVKDVAACELLRQSLGAQQ